MTMEQPSTGIVRNKGDHQVGVRVQHGNVPAWSIVDIERGVGVEFAFTLCQNPKVVPVQVDGMVDCASIVDDEVRPLVCLWQ